MALVREAACLSRSSSLCCAYIDTFHTVCMQNRLYTREAAYHNLCKTSFTWLLTSLDPTHQKGSSWSIRIVDGAHFLIHIILPVSHIQSTFPKMAAEHFYWPPNVTVQWQMMTVYAVEQGLATGGPPVFRAWKIIWNLSQLLLFDLLEKSVCIHEREGMKATVWKLVFFLFYFLITEEAK